MKNSQNKKTWWKSFIGLCCFFIGVFLVILTPILIIKYLTDGYYHGSEFSGPAIVDYLKYLENKYGKNEGFYYVETNGNNCAVLNAGFCKRDFSTKALNGKTFEVTYRKSAQSNFIDQYWLIRYEPQLDAYYRQLFDSAIPYNYSLNFEGIAGNQSALNISLEELMSSENISINIEIITTYEEVPDLSNIDLKTIKTQVSDIVSALKTPKINRIEFIVNTEGSNMTGSCPNGMSTTGAGGKDGEIKSCSSLLLSSSMHQ